MTKDIPLPLHRRAQFLCIAVGYIEKLHMWNEHIASSVTSICTYITQLHIPDTLVYVHMHEKQVLPVLYVIEYHACLSSWSIQIHNISTSIISTSGLDEVIPVYTSQGNKPHHREEKHHQYIVITAYESLHVTQEKTYTAH